MPLYCVWTSLEGWYYRYVPPSTVGQIIPYQSGCCEGPNMLCFIVSHIRLFGIGNCWRLKIGFCVLSMPSSEMFSSTEWNYINVLYTSEHSTITYSQPLEKAWLISLTSTEELINSPMTKRFCQIATCIK